ncbi:hypothetical protein F511_20077 [Dorcoceras hygrometricum]|uniref:Uncharacterized protein n=1 Tax=Dorcoceras hygrometricum TaxID=472368 RepID=A0A2Z7DCC5_9LAMI|nr:hypothetical protein F511_20077 [Dorcoceras hygrometricum]
MRSVVASHGPGSNPRGDAICNAILLQSFPVLQIFGLQYLDRHRPPYSDVLPLNLAQKLKISKSIKTGPTSRIGPKTSRAARDRPEPNPRRNQTSRHDIAGDSPEHRRSGGRPAAATNKTNGDSVRDAAPRRRKTVRKSRAQRASSVDLQRLFVRPSSHVMAQHAAAAIGHRRAWSIGMKRDQHATPPHPAARNFAQASRKPWPTTCDNHTWSSGHESAAVHNECAALSRALAHADCGRYRQSGPGPETRLLRQPALEGLTRSARMDSPRRIGRKQFSGEDGRRQQRRTAGGGGGVCGEDGRRLICA